MRRGADADRARRRPDAAAAPGGRATPRSCDLDCSQIGQPRGGDRRGRGRARPAAGQLRPAARRHPRRGQGARPRPTSAELDAELAEVEANLREAVVDAPGAGRGRGRRGPPRRHGRSPTSRSSACCGPSDLWVKAFVPETELGKLRLGQEVEVTIDSYPGRRFPGTVDHIAAVSEFTPRNVQSVDERRHQVFAVKVRWPTRRACSSRAWPPRCSSLTESTGGEPMEPADRASTSATSRIRFGEFTAVDACQL